METNNPLPHHSKALAAHRWRRIGNRWLVLVVTVLVSISSNLFMTLNDNVARHYWIQFMEGFASLIGATLPQSFVSGVNVLLISLGGLWFYPVALRLGWLRGAMWISLIGVGLAVASLFQEGILNPQNRPEAFPVTLTAFFPCLAMIGRRTRPWMSVPASAASAVGLMFEPKMLNLRWINLEDFSINLIGIGGILAYTAILIFGTKLIPKQPPTPPADC